MIKKLLLVIITLNMLTACQSEAVDTSGYTWGVEVLDAVSVENLSTDTEVTQYDGSISKERYEQNASTGYRYVLVELSLIKQVSGGDSFEWTDIGLVDSAGNAYSRLEDGFLELHQYERLPQIELKIGEYEGWIAFEVKEEAIETLHFFYDATEGYWDLPLTLK